jgi:hypothetical protein
MQHIVLIMQVKAHMCATLNVHLIAYHVTMSAYLFLASTNANTATAAGLNVRTTQTILKFAVNVPL